MASRRTLRLTPMQARTKDEICSLPRDNVTWGTWWAIFNDPSEVVICQQETGSPSTGAVTIPRHEFDELVRWYTTGRKRASVGAKRRPVR